MRQGTAEAGVQEMDVVAVSDLNGRIRILSDEKVHLIVEGVMGIESDAVPPVYLRFF